MTIPVENFLADIGEERRAAIRAGAEEIVAEQQTLAALRRARGLTQAQVAGALETSQANVAQIEQKNDSLVSTIARVVRALGAELEISARFRDGTIVPLQVGGSAEKIGGSRLQVQTSEVQTSEVQTSEVQTS